MTKLESSKNIFNVVKEALMHYGIDISSQGIAYPVQGAIHEELVKQERINNDRQIKWFFIMEENYYDNKQNNWLF